MLSAAVSSRFFFPLPLDQHPRFRSSPTPVLATFFHLTSTPNPSRSPPSSLQSLSNPPERLRPTKSGTSFYIASTSPTTPLRALCFEHHYPRCTSSPPLYDILNNMKFTTALFALISASAAIAASVDTNDSGLTTLGERSFERKARHVEAVARSTEDDLEKRDWVSKWGKVTWYAGGQLANPACGGPTPTDNSKVVAVKKNGGYGKCGETVHLHYNGKMVSATIVDYCEACSWGHFDATKSVFKALAPLSQGVIEGIHFKLFTKN